MADKIVAEPLPGAMQTLGESIPFGTCTVIMPRGEIEAVDAPGYTTLLVTHSDPAFNRIAFMLYALDPDRLVPGKGMIAQMTADQARNIAASLCRLAEQLEPGSTH